MTLIVDFNMTKPDGLIPALLTASDFRGVHIGDKVTAVDGEGTECKAEVITITQSARGAYALLRPLGGTWRGDSSHRFTVGDIMTR